MSGLGVHWEASVEYVPDSTSIVRLEVVTVGTLWEASVVCVCAGLYIHNQTGGSDCRHHYLSFLDFLLSSLHWWWTHQVSCRPGRCEFVIFAVAVVADAVVVRMTLTVSFCVLSSFILIHLGQMTLFDALCNR